MGRQDWRGVILVLAIVGGVIAIALTPSGPLSHAALVVLGAFGASVIQRTKTSDAILSGLVSQSVPPPGDAPANGFVPSPSLRLLAEQVAIHAIRSAPPGAMVSSPPSKAPPPVGAEKEEP